MALIEIKADLNRVASALERIALAMERVSPPPQARSTPKPPPSVHPRPEVLRREIVSDLLDQGVPEGQAVAFSDLSDFELMKRGVFLDLDLADEILSEDV